MCRGGGLACGVPKCRQVACARGLPGRCMEGVARHARALDLHPPPGITYEAFAIRSALQEAVSAGAVLCSEAEGKAGGSQCDRGLGQSLKAMNRQRSDLQLPPPCRPACCTCTAVHARMLIHSRVRKFTPLTVV